MRIAAAICWYDEPIEHLERVIASVAPIASVIVAFDGAWDGFPHKRARSAPAQARAIRAAAAAYSLDAIVPAGRAWPSQAAKRTALYRNASFQADWVLVIDADEEMLIDDPTRFRQQIARIDRAVRADSVRVRVATPGPRGAGGHDTATAPYGVRYQPRILRADTSLTVGPHSHRTIVTDDAVLQMENADDRALHVSRRAGRTATIHGASIVNRTHSRSAARISAKQAYGKARAERGID